jgi:hypothetical protein
VRSAWTLVEVGGKYLFTGHFRALRCECRMARLQRAARRDARRTTPTWVLRAAFPCHKSVVPVVASIVMGDPLLDERSFNI